MSYKINSNKKIDQNLVSLINILTKIKLIIGFAMVRY